MESIASGAFQIISLSYLLPSEEQVATREEFLENWPLYTLCDCPNFYPPDSISLRCKNCEKETTWIRTANNQLYNTTPMTGYIIVYECGLCKNNKPQVTFFVRDAVKAQSSPYGTLKVQKVGQFPSQSIDIDRELEKRLGDSAPLYKNALICRGVNFGIGALAYIRRVVENKANELIEVVAEQAESYGTDPQIVTAIRAAMDEKMTFDQRLQLASEAIPSSLKVDGANPLAALHGLLSAGLHAQSEEECITIMDEIRDIFEYVFARLRAEIEDRNRMVSKVKKLFGTRKTKGDDAGELA